MSPVRDHRRPAESWPPPHKAPRAGQPPKIRPVSNLAPLASWVDQARCHGRWAEFDPSPAEETRGELNARVASAAKICAACPVLDRCREYARTASPPVTGILAGVYHSPNTSRMERNRSA